MIYEEIKKIQEPLFQEILKLKKIIVQYYRKNKRFDPNAIDRFAQIFATHKDMIRALSFMKYEINSTEFTAKDFEEIYNR
tara:strand:+ start:1461 stop:1700 length:240 start_codon:yes stop_codon:yes gene_type:complete